MLQTGTVHRAAIFAAIVGLTLLGFFQFPGHTYLHSDTQIYVPMLERLLNPALYANDFVTRDPHLQYTLYDEAAVVLRRLGLEFQTALVMQQLLFRALGVYGVYLLALALRLTPRASLVVAAFFSLGTLVSGPAILTVEYEPVPRGFAAGLLLLAVGWGALGRLNVAGVAASVAFLYHPPAAIPVLIVLCGIAIFKRRWDALIAPLAAIAILILFANLQPGVVDRQSFLSRLDPGIAELQRFRAAYNWISLWTWQQRAQYGLLWMAGMGALWRIRRDVPPAAWPLLAGLPLIGLLSMPLSYLLLDVERFAVMAQFQPARALLFVTALSCILAAVAGIKAAERGRRIEAVAWFALVFTLPTCILLTDIGAHMWLVLSLALLAMAMMSAEATGSRWAGVAAVCAMVIPYFAIPVFGLVHNYQRLETQDVDDLAAWAKANTAEDSVFVFPEIGRSLQPGIFKTRAQRALWADWKGGGQVNYFPRVAEEWKRRWSVLADNGHPPTLERWRQLGVDYVVIRKTGPVPLPRRVYENGSFLVLTAR